VQERSSARGSGRSSRERRGTSSDELHGLRRGRRRRGRTPAMAWASKEWGGDRGSSGRKRARVGRSKGSVDFIGRERKRRGRPGCFMAIDASVSNESNGGGKTAALNSITRDEERMRSSAGASSADVAGAARLLGSRVVG
jgi:hypothetical protein